ncbi:MAG: DUF4399 domain-containing protein [Pseudomonadota bacterium]
MKTLMKITVATLFCAVTPAIAGDTPSKDGTVQYFVNLTDGDTVSSPLTVIFGLKGMGVAPAGVEKENTGHHHILLNRPPLGEGEDGAEELENSLPADEHHIHFGGGQTEVTLDLEPGEHTLQLVLADHYHAPHNPPITSDRITITVK